MRTPPEVYAWSRFGAPEYTTWLDENLSWKTTCYIGDWSFLWQHWFRGPDVLRLFSEFSVNDFTNFAIGQSKHVIHTNRNGKVIHEGILTRFADEEFMLHGRGGFWMKFQADRSDYDIQVESDDWFIYQVSGPNAIKVLQKLDPSTSYLDTKYMWVAPITIAGHTIHALRQGMAGEVGFELQGPAAIRDEIYEAVVEAGQEYGIRKMGGRVSLINHVEACYPTIATDYIPAIFDEETKEYLEYFLSSMPPNAQPAYIAGSYRGHDISSYYRSPVELGWGKVVRGSGYLGQEALEAEKAEPQRVIRTLVWNADDVTDVYASLFRKGEPNYTFMDMPRDQRGFMWADRVEVNGKLVGVTTSRGYSHWFRETISLCPIDLEYAEIGTQVTIAWGNPGDPEKSIRATVAPAPFKEDNRRLDLHAAT
ncbi:MAG TPA: glycine cleavage system protein T [Microbacterium sp.]|nr:glycine cleavage system protein T [Microbacterium sp.]HBR88594.1 glycine cleavage system protein T [Microbacterium sp.]